MKKGANMNSYFFYSLIFSFLFSAISNNAIDVKVANSDCVFESVSENQNQLDNNVYDYRNQNNLLRINI
jgi:hypothetical protein